MPISRPPSTSYMPSIGMSAYGSTYGGRPTPAPTGSTAVPRPPSTPPSSTALPYAPSAPVIPPPGYIPLGPSVPGSGYNTPPPLDKEQYNSKVMEYDLDRLEDEKAQRKRMMLETDESQMNQRLNEQNRVHSQALTQLQNIQNMFQPQGIELANGTFPMLNMPTLSDPMMESMGGNEQVLADDAAFGKAKDRISQTTSSALQALRGAASDQGISGGGWHGQQAARTISQGGGQLGEFARDLAINRANQVAGINQRNADRSNAFNLQKAGFEADTGRFNIGNQLQREQFNAQLKSQQNQQQQSGAIAALQSLLASFR